MSNSSENDSNDLFPQLGERQQVIFEATLEDFEEYLRNEGKTPRKKKGYAERSTEVRKSRVLQVFKRIWETEGVTTDITTQQADRVIKALDTDEIRRRDGDRYAESSKRKISNALVNWFEFTGTDWEPKIKFSDELSENGADPFNKREVNALWEESLTYKSIPKYSDVSPDERDRWQRYLAQELGIPKEDVRPRDWDRVNKNWKYPSLIGTVKSAGWRPALIGRMKVHWYDPDSQNIIIPGEHAVKNDTQWTQVLPAKAARPLEMWIEQRENISKYDDTDHMWLTRKGKPYSSQTLNYFLNNLMEEAEINQRGRKLCWYSFRHSIGTYVYEEHKDLKIVADTLRQNSTESASRYVHPTDELINNAVSIL